MISLPSYVKELRLDAQDLRIYNSRLIRSVKQHRKRTGELIKENKDLKRENEILRKDNDLLKALLTN